MGEWLDGQVGFVGVLIGVCVGGVGGVGWVDGRTDRYHQATNP